MTSTHSPLRSSGVTDGVLLAAHPNPLHEPPRRHVGHEAARGHRRRPNTPKQRSIRARTASVANPRPA